MTLESTPPARSPDTPAPTPDYQVIRPPLTRAEAEGLTVAIREGLADVQTRARRVGLLLGEMHDREGWRVLGYASWRAWAAAECPHTSQTTLYKWLGEARQLGSGGNFPPKSENSEPAPALGSGHIGAGRPLGRRDAAPRSRPTPPAAPAAGSTTVFGALAAGLIPPPAPGQAPDLEQHVFTGTALRQLRALADAAGVGTLTWLTRTIGQEHARQVASEPSKPPPLELTEEAYASLSLLGDERGEAPGLVVFHLIQAALDARRHAPPPPPSPAAPATPPRSGERQRWLPKPDAHLTCPACGQVAPYIRGQAPMRCPRCRVMLAAPPPEARPPGTS